MFPWPSESPATKSSDAKNSMDYQQFLNLAGFSGMPANFVALFAVLAIWSIIWKGIALWKAARNGSKTWFIVMLVLNTVGILEIVYIFYFAKKTSKTDKPVA